MPCKILQHLGIPARKLSATQTVIYGFNANGSRPLGKIRLKCQIGDLRSEVTCYVIDANTSYNLLLGRPWIHDHFLIPSTLHQVIKYADEAGEIKTLIAEKQPFKGVENYFTDSIHYQDSLEASPVRETDSGNEADIESEPEEECLWELNPDVINVNKLHFTLADDDGEWVINENVHSDYLSAVSSELVPSETSMDKNDDPMHEMHMGSSFHLPMKSSYMTRDKTSEVQGACFVVLSKHEGQKLIFFGRVEAEATTYESSEDDFESP
jgi:hypothetical protein